MAYPDLSDLRSRVRDLLNDSGTTFVSDAMLNRWINDGERDVAVKSLCYEREWAMVTVANTRTVDYTGIKMLGIEYIPSSGNRVGLGRITPKMVGHLNINEITPQYWFPWGTKICIEPIPQAVYNLIGYIASMPEAEMSADTDEPEIPAGFIPLILKYACIRWLMRDKKYASASVEYKEYINSLTIARNNIVKKYSDVRSDFVIPNIIEPVGG